MYDKYFDKDLINTVLGKVYSSEAIIFNNEVQDEQIKKQTEFFHNNFSEYMLYTALIIFQDKFVLNIALDVLKDHTDDCNHKIIANNMILLTDRISQIKIEKDKLNLVDNPTILNYIYCELFMETYKLKIDRLQSLVRYLKQAQDHVEKIIILEVLKRKDQSKSGG